MKWKYLWGTVSSYSNTVLCVFNMQVEYCENLETSDVNKKDFFYKAFKMLLDPESKMFMYNDTKTLIWFPVEVRQKKNSYERIYALTV